jgi:phosphoserine phosphatase
MTRPQRIALFDWDNTIRSGLTILDWSEFLVEKNLFDPLEQKSIASAVTAFTNGEIDYCTLSCVTPEAYARGLRGQSSDRVRDAAGAFVESDREKLFSFAVPLLRGLEERGVETHVISGCPHEVLIAHLGSQNWPRMIGTRTQVRSNVYTGELSLNLATALGKARATAGLLGGGRALLAAGDSVSDIPLFDASELRVVVGNPGLLAPDRNVFNLDPLRPMDENIAEIWTFILDHLGPASGRTGRIV